MRSLLWRASALGALVFVLSGPLARAQDATPTPGTTAQEKREETIVVTASPVGARAEELLQAINVMGEEDLSESASAGLGDILDAMPGISTSAFGPAASRPIIRGLGGDRVRMLVNGVGIMDASTASPDHAVQAEALEATRIEVVRGPAAIVYGGNAIGGVVNVIDGRIPEKRLDGRVTGRFVAGGSSVDNGTIMAARVRTGSGPFVLNAEAVRRHGNDESIAGFARTPAIRAVEGAGPKGSLPNSDLTFNTRSIGGSYVGAGGFVGASIKRATSNYGLPQEADARIDMAQTRIDARGKIDLPFGLIDQFSIDFGTSDYRHFELEGGAIGTRFDNQGWEARTRLHQNEIAGFSGSFGFDGSHKTFSALGAESFLPKTRTSDRGAFIAERRDFGGWGIETGARIEKRRLRTASAQRKFTGISASGGLFYQPSKDIFLSASLTHTERAPTDIELFSEGPHLAESTFEHGNAALKKEKALSFEGIARVHILGWDMHVNLFRTHFDKFIFLKPTGAQIDGLNEFSYTQSNAHFAGSEISLHHDLWRGNTWTLHGDGAAEYVRAKTANLGNLPRIPPLEITGGLNLDTARFENRAEIVWTDRQNKLTAFETPTKGSTIINLSTTWRPDPHNDDVRLVFKVSNLTDATHRTHASFLKDRVPSPGRNFSARLVYDF